MIRIRNKKSPDITVWCTKNITYTMPKLTKLDGQLKKTLLTWHTTKKNVKTTSSFRNHEKMIVETQLQKKNENGEDVQKSDKQLERPKSKRRWTKHYSAEYQQFYLHDEETNESIWDEHSASEEEHP